MRPLYKFLLAIFVFILIALCYVMIARAGSPPKAVDATSTNVFFAPNGADMDRAEGYEEALVIERGKPFSRAYIYCDIDSSADLVFTPWKITVSGTDTTWGYPGFWTRRSADNPAGSAGAAEDTLGTVHKGAKYVLMFQGQVDAILISDGEGSITCE